MSRRMRWIATGVLTAAVAAAIGVFAWRQLLDDTTTPLAIDAALAAYREAAAAGDTPIPTGVYVYRTSGKEFVSALGGTTHAYPARSTIAVTRHPCGMQLHWAPLEERSSTWIVCAEGEELRQPAWVELHRFFGQDDRSRWECGNAPWSLPPDSSPVAYRCKNVDTLQQGTMTRLRDETLVVAGAEVGVAHLRIRVDESGQARGTLVEDRWLELDTGLPVRMRYRAATKNASPIGDVTFEESYTLDLTSLEPRR